ncbi:NarK/NasA family nitrate transporter [Allopusillimonas soli]|uniref:NarK/NasA family nitrate transporter n=2 Tax=Allopusillimonas soli TaxID=659016 RepID=A0A853F7A7_9BURK|nr:NarK/NasA family nitrate transporter [Allopusillimonas soli]TEA76758.1 NarK/NasA family nitrate transporter [Allopusillimonas soli]
MLVLGVTTFAFMVCFVVWMMFGVLGIPLREEMGLNSAEFGLLSATPVLSGALLRLPLGMWTDRFGGRTVMTLLLLVCAVPVYAVSYAQAFWQFLAIGLVLGIVGASFAVGTPYVARLFPPEKRGFAMGVFGAGTVGAAVNLFITPSLQEALGWRAVPRIYAISLVITAVVFWFGSVRDPGTGAGTAAASRPFAVLRDARVWRYCQYYSICFGGFTALSLWIPQYMMAEYHYPIVLASAMAAGFTLPGAVLRAAGGMLADRFGAHAITWWGLWVAWVCLFVLSYPDTVFTINTINGPRSFAIHVPPSLFIVLLFILGTVFAFGMASTFKYVADDFPQNMGIVTGIVGLAGGVGGFLLPVLFGAALDLTGIRSSTFMLLYGIVWISLILLYQSNVRHMRITGQMEG